jgi:1,4-dihydroxy-2-naphthoate octaprenyltransferase
VASRAASAAGNRPNASEERTASDEDNVVVEGVVMPDEDDDDGDSDSRNPTGHGEESPSAPAVDEETEKAFRAQVATAFDAVAMDANFQDDLRRRSEESEGDRGVNRESPMAPTRATLWWRAIKLPMYSVALAPLAVAGALCHHWYGCVNVPQWGALTAGACLIIAW